MLEHYFVRPATVDRIRANVAGAYIEHYVSWLRTQGYADRNVFRRVPILCQFGEKSGSTNLNSEISGNSVDIASTGMVRQSGVFHGQAEEEGWRCQADTQATHRGIQGASGTCRAT